MGEILKAAGCGYDNGEENFTVWKAFWIDHFEVHLEENFFLTWT